MSALGLAGWTGCALALALAVVARRALEMRLAVQRRACHELRGVLTATRLGLELEARCGRLAPARRRALELELSRAAAVLEDLVATGTAIPSAEGRAPATDLADLLADSVEAWRPAARSRGVELRLSWSGPPAVVAADPSRLAQVTSNLIANALEHGAGPVLVRGGVGRGRARVEVLDGGPGLSAPIAELIKRNRGHGSHGHGLAIASTIATAHGGRLTSAPSRAGARLVLELPTLREALERATP